MKPGEFEAVDSMGFSSERSHWYLSKAALLPQLFPFILESSYKCSSSITALRNVPIAELLLYECDLSIGKLVEDNL